MSQTSHHTMNAITIKGGNTDWSHLWTSLTQPPPSLWKVRRVLRSWLEKMSGWRGLHTEQLAITQHWPGLD